MVNKCKDIANKWRELPYYVQYFGALFIMVTPTLLIIALQASWGNASSILNLVICLGSCFLSRAALPQNQRRIGGESALPIVVLPLRGACNNPHCIIRMQLGPQWSSWSRGEGARGEIAFRTDGATANPGDNLFLCGRSRKTRKMITKKPDAFARPIFFIFLE